MGLSEIAAKLEVTAEQRERGVATVDDTGGDLVERLEPHAEALPCSPADAAVIVEAYAGGETVGGAGRAAGQPPMTAAKTLHLVGVDGVCPLGPTGLRLVRDWLAGELSRAKARELADASETEFLLGVYVETHDPIEGAREAVEPELGPGGNASVRKRDRLAETMSGVDEFVQ